MLERSQSGRGPDIYKLLEARRKYGREAESRKAGQFRATRVLVSPTMAEAWEYWRKAWRPTSSISWSKASAPIDVSEEAFSGIRKAIDDLAASVESVSHELASCRETIDRLSERLDERPLPKETSLFDIDETLNVIQPVPIVIEESTYEVIASFPELQVFAVGDNEPEAISNLKAAIRDLYYDLVETPKDELGRLPLSWLRILERLVKRVGNP